MTDSAALKPEEDDQFETTEGWHRLHPLAMLHYLFLALKAIIDQGPNLLAPGLLVFGFFRDNLAFGAVFLLALFLVIGGVTSLLSYLRLRYRIVDQRILMRKGVLTAKRLTLNFDRVQSINISEPLYFRPFGLASIELESAGSSKSEVSLLGVPLEQAKAIRSEILAFQKNVAKTASASEEPSIKSAAGDESPVVLTRSTGDLVRYGLSNDGIWLFAALLASFVGGNAENFSMVLTPEVSALLQNIKNAGSLGIAAAILIVLIVIVALMLLVSVIVAILQYHKYRLTRHGGRLVRRSGLLELKEASLKESKIQALNLHQNLFARLLGVRHMRLRQAGAATNEIQAGQKAFLLPSLSPGDQEDTITSKLINGLEPNTLTFQNVNPRYVLRSFSLTTFTPLALIGLILASVVSWQFLLLPFASFVLLPLFILRYKRYGYALTPDFIVIKHGFIGQSMTCFQNYKLQRVELAQSPSERKHGLATLKLFYAGVRQVVPYMPYQHAKFMADQLLYKAESDTSDWL